MRSATVLAVLCVAITTVSAQNLVKGRCPYIRPIKNFNIKKYTGIWYERERTKTTLTNNQICSVAEYLLGIPNTVRLVNRGYDRVTNRPVVINVNAIRNPKVKSQFGLLFDPKYGRTGYNILATDYKSYTLNFACRERYDRYGALFNEQVLYLKSRTRGAMPSKTMHMLYSLARSYGIPLQHMERVVQSGCPVEH